MCDILQMSPLTGPPDTSMNSALQSSFEAAAHGSPGKCLGGSRSLAPAVGAGHSPQDRERGVYLALIPLGH